MVGILNANSILFGWKTNIECTLYRTLLPAATPTQQPSNGRKRKKAGISKNRYIFQHIPGKEKKKTPPVPRKDEKKNISTYACAA